jgi:Ppx/GppA phosphatase family
MQTVPAFTRRPRGAPCVSFLFTAGLLAGCLSAPAARAQTATHGGIEIGSKGVKATVIEVTPGREGPASRQLFSKTANTTIAALKDGKLREDAIAETAEEVERFFKQMRTEFRVPADNIYIVGSSGVPKAPNSDELVKAVKTRTGKDLRFIDAQTETALTIAGVVKPDLRAESVLVDIGSGNTKGGYLTGTGQARRVASFSVPYGTVTYTAQVKKQAGEAGKFVETAARLRDDLLTRPIAAAVERNPELVKRQRVYLSGGMSWALATLVKPQAAEEAYVSLTADDIEAFHRLVTKTPGAFPEVDLSQVKDARARTQAAKDLRRVKDVFTPENLISGSEILRSLSTALKFKDRRLFFPRYGYVAWIQSYVLDRATPGGQKPPDVGTKPPDVGTKPPPGGTVGPPVGSPPVVVYPSVYSSPTPCSPYQVYYPAPCYSYPVYYPAPCYTYEPCCRPCRRGFRLFRR